MKKVLILFITIFIINNINAQSTSFSPQFTKADTLRGMLSPARTCYDVTYYHLNIRINPKEKAINGYVDMRFKTVQDFLTLQVDLFENMNVDKVILLGSNEALKVKRSFNAVFINMGKRVPANEELTIRIFYSGNPITAKNAPWDGGFVWAKDAKERDWIGVACEGTGASLWWPNKDHLSDEPDSMDISVAVPKGLTCIANGQLVGEESMEDGYQKFHWKVSYPINNYNVTVNIAHYTHIHEKYRSKDSELLDLDYYVLDYNEEIARKHFKQVTPTLQALEHYFGKYPFWKDGYALVETPYLGMEHQGAIAYGNQYKRGYLGGMIPRDMNFDYIIVHETGHEYFGNSVSCNDHAELWIHESFTTYTEALFVEYTMSYEDAVRYLNSQKYYISNASPIVGPLNVNYDNWGHSDIYYKGAWMLHTLRHCINNDDLWWEIMMDSHQEYRIKNIVTQDFIDFINKKTGKDFTTFFQQYLYHSNIPTLEYKIKKKRKKQILEYRWVVDVENFQMPVSFHIGEDKEMITATTKWQSVVINSPQKIKFDEEVFLVNFDEVD